MPSPTRFPYLGRDLQYDITRKKLTLMQSTLISPGLHVCVHTHTCKMVSMKWYRLCGLVDLPPEERCRTVSSSTADVPPPGPA